MGLHGFGDPTVPGTWGKVGTTYANGTGGTQYATAGGSWKKVPKKVRDKVDVMIAAEVMIVGFGGVDSDKSKRVILTDNDEIFYHTSGWEATKPSHPGKTGGRRYKVDQRSSQGRRIIYVTDVGPVL